VSHLKLMSIPDHIFRLGSALKCYKCAEGDTVCKENLQVQDCEELPHELKSKGGSNVCIDAAFIIDGQMGIKRECAQQSEFSSLKICLCLFFFQFLQQSTISVFAL
jgi:hypothetical protein